MIARSLAIALLALAVGCDRGPGPNASSAPDARTAEAEDRAPVLDDVAGLPDFAMFRECELCPEMIILPAGEYTMGSDAQPALGPARPMRVQRFAIARDKVSRRQWAACVEAGACDADVDPIDDLCAALARSEGVSATGCTPDLWARIDGPVGGLNWQRATAFVNWLNQTAALQGEAGYRLASEAEWEYAMRANANYPWDDGGAMCQLARQAACDEIEFPSGDSLRTPSGPNAFGLRDFFPAIELVEDCYAQSISLLPDDGGALSAQGCLQHTIRLIGFQAQAGGTTWGRFPYDAGGTSGGAGSYITLRVARTLAD